MKYPDAFYTSKTVSQVAYQDTPTGNLSVSRFIRHQSYWIKPSLPRAREPKTMILNDFMASTWSWEKTRAVIEGLRTMMNDGFKVYVCVFKQLIPLTEDNLDELEQVDFRGTIKSAFAEDIQTYARAQLGLSADEIQLLDDYWLYPILHNGALPEQRTLNLHDLAWVTTEINQVDRLESIIHNLKPPVSALVDDHYPQTRLDIYELSRKLTTQYPKKPVNITNLYLSSSRISEISAISQELHTVESLTIKLDLRLTATADEDWQYIKQLTHLKKISIDSMRSLPEDLITVLTTTSFPSLIELNASRLPTDSAILANILTNMPHLKKLSLSTAFTERGIRYEIPNALHELEDIELRIPIWPQSFTSLLENNPNLRRIWVENTPLREVLNLPEYGLPQLSQFYLDKAEITSESLATLLNNTPKLRTLTLSSSNITGQKFAYYGPLNKLDSLDLSHSTMDVKILAPILQTTPSLCDLVLTETTLQGTINPVYFPLSNLSRLILEATQTESPVFLQALFTALKEIQYINATAIEFSEHLTLTPNHYPKLHTLLLDNADINTASIQRLLIAAPNLANASLPPLPIEDYNEILQANQQLQTLTLHIGNLQGTFNLHPPALAHLKNLTITKADSHISCITMEALASLLILARDLVTLLVKEGVTLKGTIDLPANHFPKLKQIVIEHEITAELKDHLKTAAQNARVLHRGIMENHVYGQTHETLDADTSKNTHQQYHANEIFIPLHASQRIPDPSEYRLDVYETVTVTAGPCDIRHAFHMQKQGGYAFIACQATRSETDVFSKGKSLPKSPEHVYGKQTLILNTEWQALASLSAEDELTDFHITPHDSEIEIQYSIRDNLYYIRRKAGEPQAIEIDFLLKRSEALDTASLPEDVNALIRDIHAYGEQALDLQNNAYTGEDYYQRITRQKTGACRHRAFVFKREMDKRHPELQTRIVVNDIHAYAEVLWKDRWITCQLGGYESNVTITPAKKPKTNLEAPALEEPSSAETAPDNPNQASSSQAELTDTASQPISAIQPPPVIAPPDVEPPETTTSSIEPPSFITEEMEKRFQRYLETWNTSPAENETLLSYCQDCVSKLPKHKKRLIKVDSDEAEQGLYYALRKHCESIQRPIFYVNSPDDLVCSAPYIRRDERDNQRGILTPPPGGPFYDFLEQYKGQSPVIVVRYSQFETDDLIRFNTLIDEQRKTDHPNVSIPDDALIIGTLNTNQPDCYEGADFYSRFPTVETCPIPTQTLSECILPLNVSKATEAEHNVVINLFHALDWKERLLGRWVLDRNDLRFEAGLLSQALCALSTSNNATLELQNAPWDDEEFVTLWRDALLTHEIAYEGDTIALPNTLQLKRRDGYDWRLLLDAIEIVPNVHTTLALNPHGLMAFFSRYDCDNQQLIQSPGLLEQHAHKPLHVTLTHSLNEDEWAMLLTECRTHHVTLKVQCAPEVELPEPLQGKLPKAPHPETASSALPESNNTQMAERKTQVIVSTDADTTIAQLTRTDPEWQVIDVSECRVSDLLEGLHGNFEETTLHYTFHKTTGALINGLENGKKIILTGDYSDELCDHLNQYLIKRLHGAENTLGQMVLITKHRASFSALPTHHHPVTPEEKLVELATTETEAAKLKPYLEKESLARLQARLAYLRRNPSKSTSDEAWIGFDSLPLLSPTVHPVHLPSAEAAVEQFHEERRRSILDALEASPYVFLTGLTGVGKSTFIETNFCAKEQLFIGENETKAWATADCQGPKYLFIDEANITDRQWSEFEGLFSKEPGILIDGEYHRLTPFHKVIFAGNPLSYGDERTLPQLFQRHGKALVFEPLPPEVLYVSILKPILEHTPFLEPKLDFISNHLLAIYQFLAAYSQSEVLISPRELQMMALLIRTRHQNNPSQSIEAITEDISWNVAKHLVPETARARFDARFKPRSQTNSDERILLNNAYLVTPSRKNAYEQLQDVLALREARQEPTDTPNDVALYGGLGGLILEGEPAAGKTELVINTLLSRGYEEEKEVTHPTQKPKPFYRMSVSMSLEEKDRLLKKAFHEGAVVVIDEINSSPMMERLLNQLLMGKTSKGERPQKPGFLVIGTQNPITLSGRRAPSNALKRRLLTMEVPPYSTEELVEVLSPTNQARKRGIANALAKIYQERYEFGRKHHYKPLPTLRHLVHLRDIAEQCERNTSWLRSFDYPNLFEKLNNLAERLAKKAIKNEKYTQADNAAKDLIKNLSKAEEGFFVDGDKNAFITSCYNALSKARETLKLHRGSKQIWTTVLPFLAALPTLFISEYAARRHGLFTAKTQSEKVIDEEGIQKPPIRELHPGHKKF